MTDRLVLIIEVGPTGLVLALWLTRLEVRVRMLARWYHMHPGNGILHLPLARVG
jgi:hypothetical protein